LAKLIVMADRLQAIYYAAVGAFECQLCKQTIPLSDRIPTRALYHEAVSKLNQHYNECASDCRGRLSFADEGELSLSEGGGLSEPRRERDPSRYSEPERRRDPRMSSEPHTSSYPGWRSEPNDGREPETSERAVP
jgi:hypothetical protein